MNLNTVSLSSSSVVFNPSPGFAPLSGTGDFKVNSDYFSVDSSGTLTYHGASRFALVSVIATLHKDADGQVAFLFAIAQNGDLIGKPTDAVMQRQNLPEEPSEWYANVVVSRAVILSDGDTLQFVGHEEGGMHVVDIQGYQMTVLLS